MSMTATEPKTTNPASATLISMRKHNRTYEVPEATLRQIAAPEPTKTWMPIPHATLLDHVLHACQARNLAIQRQQFTVSRDRQQFFGVLVLAGGAQTDYSVALGLRNSTDKSMPAGLATGAHVMVCDNLSLCGDIVLKHKHTSQLLAHLPVLVGQALDRFMIQAGAQATVFESWKRHQIPVEKATDLIVRAADAGVIPGFGIIPVRNEFLKPRHAEFSGETVWTLYNAFTQYMTHDRGAVSPEKTQRDYIHMHRLVVSDFPVTN